jgi:hypothetical protein
MLGEEIFSAAALPGTELEPRRRRLTRGNAALADRALSQ